MTKRKNIILITLAACLIGSFLTVYHVFFSSCVRGDDSERYLYIRPGQDIDYIRQSLSEMGVRTTGFGRLQRVLGYDIRQGRYAIRKGDNILTVFRRLRNGQQEPLKLTIPSVRTVDRLAGYLSHHLMIDSLNIVDAFTDSTNLVRFGITPPDLLMAVFRPDTYEVYWTISTDDLIKRMQNENIKFWDGEREEKADEMGMKPEEVVILASIIDEETANDAEKPMVAGMYINRLRQGMPLQADPTVKFALGDFSLRRIYQKHLSIDSPYNTYRNTGLPPGPIRIASVAGIDAVLNYVHHDYLYMCAKEDFSGTHNFARTYAEHLQNARRYTQALNQRNVR